MRHPHNLSFTSPRPDCSERCWIGSVRLKTWTTLTLLLLSLNAVIVPEANAQGDAGQVFGKMIGLFHELKRQKRESTVQPSANDELAPQNPPEKLSPYKVGDFRLGQNVSETSLSGYTCKPSDQFEDFTWCVRSTKKHEARGAFTLSESILRSPDGKAVYVNRSYSPAFFAANEIESDIGQRTHQLGEKPRIVLSPHREGLPDGVIAIWGNVSLEPLHEQGIALLSNDRSPQAGFIVDFLNDPTVSANRGLPVYRLVGDGAGYLWAATVDKEGNGKLRFMAVDALGLSRAANGPNTANNLPPRSVTEAPEHLAKTRTSESLETKWSRLETQWKIAAAKLEADKGGLGGAHENKAPDISSEIHQATAAVKLEAEKEEGRSFYGQQAGGERTPEVADGPTDHLELAAAEATATRISDITRAWKSERRNRQLLIFLVLALGVSLTALLIGKFKTSLARRAIFQSFPPLLPVVGSQETILEEDFKRPSIKEPKYATAECNHCHIRLPKPEMVSKTKYSFSYKLGRQHSRRMVKNGRAFGTDNWRGPGSVRTKSKDIWLCKDCSRSQTTSSGLAILLAFIVVVGLILVANAPH